MSEETVGGTPYLESNIIIWFVPRCEFPLETGIRVWSVEFRLNEDKNRNSSKFVDKNIHVPEGWIGLICENKYDYDSRNNLLYRFGIVSASNKVINVCDAEWVQECGVKGYFKVSSFLLKESVNEEYLPNLRIFCEAINKQDYQSGEAKNECEAEVEQLRSCLREGIRDIALCKKEAAENRLAGLLKEFDQIDRATASSIASTSAANTEDNWKCRLCTLINPADALNCEACNLLKSVKDQNLEENAEAENKEKEGDVITNCNNKSNEVQIYDSKKNKATKPYLREYIEDDVIVDYKTEANKFHLQNLKLNDADINVSMEGQREVVLGSNVSNGVNHARIKDLQVSYSTIKAFADKEIEDILQGNSITAIETCLRCIRNLEKLSQNFKELYTGNKNADITFKVKNREFKAHKAILRTRSSVFDAILSPDASASTNNVIPIEDCEPDIFDIFLLFIYTGKLENVSFDNLFELYHMAERYAVKDLTDECVYFFKKSLSIETICDMLRLSAKYSETELLQSALKFFAVNLEEILPGGMAENTEDHQILLSPRKITSSADYTLKVPNFFTLPEYDGTSFRLESPSFDFANATWCFQFLSREWKTEETENGIISFAMCMRRLNFEIPRQMISYSVNLLDKDDEKYKFSYDTDVFSDNNERHVMFIPSNEKHSYRTRGRNTLTLIVHLFDATSTEVNSAEVSVTTDRNAKVLCQDFKKLFLNGKNHDLILRVSNKEFRVHQDILTARSQVFQAMLSQDMTEKNKGVIDVPDCDPEAMAQLLFYVYSGKVESLNQNNVRGLYYAADKYSIDLLKKECSEFMIRSLCPSKVCDIIQLAMKHNDAYLLQRATEYFRYHANEIFRTSEWLSFMKLNLDTANELLLTVSDKWPKYCRKKY